jgi:hypothetical protein
VGAIGLRYISRYRSICRSFPPTSARIVSALAAFGKSCVRALYIVIAGLVNGMDYIWGPGYKKLLRNTMEWT